MDAFRRVVLVLLAGVASGIGLAAAGFFIILGGDLGMLGEHYGAGVLPIGGAAAGLVATVWILLERRFLTARLHAFFGGLVAYYLGVFTFWMAMARADVVDEGSSVPWSAWWQEVIEGTLEILGVATWPFGVLTIPLCFLLRAWILHIHDPRPAASDTLHP